MFFKFEGSKYIEHMYFLRILSKGVLWWQGNLHGKMHCGYWLGKADLEGNPAAAGQGSRSQGNSRGPSKRFVLGTFFLSWHSDIFIEGRDKTILETMVSQQNIALSALDALRKIENYGFRAIFRQN